jgi:hypothetical protein
MAITVMEAKKIKMIGKRLIRAGETCDNPHCSYCDAGVEHWVTGLTKAPWEVRYDGRLWYVPGVLTGTLNRDDAEFVALARNALVDDTAWAEFVALREKAKNETMANENNFPS